MYALVMQNNLTLYDYVSFVHEEKIIVILFTYALPII